MARHSEIEWNDRTSYKVRVGVRGRANVVKWIVSDDGRQVRALASDGKYYAPHELIPTPSKTRRPKVVEGKGIFAGLKWISAPTSNWMPHPGGKLEKQLLEGKVGTPQQQRAYARRKTAIEKLEKEHFPDDD